MSENKSHELLLALWHSADQLRSKMEASEFQSYILGLVFYKYLSDKLLTESTEMIDHKGTDLDEALVNYTKLYTTKDATLSTDYSLSPELTFQSLLHEIDDQTFQREHLQQALSEIEQSNIAYKDIFGDLDLSSNELGAFPEKKNETIANIMKEFRQLNLSEYQGDVLGDAYEYLINQFAAISGKKTGEFYTPHQMNNILSHIAILGKEKTKKFTIYDPTMGSGSLLLNVKKYSDEPTGINYVGQELNTSTYNLARMNFLLHDVPVEQQTLRNGDTLDKDWPESPEEHQFDAVVMNPPYAVKNWNKSALEVSDPRFEIAGVLPPNTKGDFAFLLHGYHHLKEDGTMVILLPHGVLFRGAAEGTIRQKLLENGAIDAVIGLPSNLLHNTSIPTVAIVLKKNRTNKDVLFIDASQEFDKHGFKVTLNDKHVEKIIETYKERKSQDKYAYLASFEEIVENDFNLNIPRYVDTFKKEEVSLKDISASLSDTEKELDKVNKELAQALQQLQVETAHEESLSGFIKYISK